MIKKLCLEVKRLFRSKMLGKLEGVFDMDVLKQQRIDYEHRFQLQSELEKLPSHFNHQIEKVSRFPIT